MFNSARFEVTFFRLCVAPLLRCSLFWLLSGGVRVLVLDPSAILPRGAVDRRPHGHMGMGVLQLQLQLQLRLRLGVDLQRQGVTIYNYESS